MKFEVKGFSELETGANTGALFSCKIAAELTYKHQDVPACYLVVDHKFGFCVVSIYHAEKEKFKYGSELLIKNPSLCFINLEQGKTLHSYPCIRVTSLYNILLDKEPMVQAADTVRTEVFS